MDDGIIEGMGSKYEQYRVASEARQKLFYGEPDLSRLKFGYKDPMVRNAWVWWVEGIIREKV